MRDFLKRFRRRLEPIDFPEIKAIVQPTPRADPPHHEVVPVRLEPQGQVSLTRQVYPDLIDVDYELANEAPNRLEEEDIEAALDLLRGGLLNRRTPGYRATKPARFQLAMRHVDGFASQCLAVQPSGQIRTAEMYAGYLVWAEDNAQPPVPQRDFDYALVEFISGSGGYRSAANYCGCRFRPEFASRLQQLRGEEVQRRLKSGLEGLSRREG